MSKKIKFVVKLSKVKAVVKIRKYQLILKTVPRADIENKGSDDDNDNAA